MVLKMPTLTLFYDLENERLFEYDSKRGLIVERNINMETSRTISVQKIVEDRE